MKANDQESVEKYKKQLDEYMKTYVLEKLQREYLKEEIGINAEIGALEKLLDSSRSSTVNLHELKEKLYKCVDSIGGLINQHLNSTKLAQKIEELKVVEETPKAAAEQVEKVEIVEEEEPQLLSKAEAEENPIKAAAQELKVEIFKWAESNDMITLAKELSEATFLLSQYYKTNLSEIKAETKAKLLESAIQIYKLSTMLDKKVVQLLKDCKDQRLVSDCKKSMEKMSTLSTQLKILAAVKATNPRDNDTHLQMNVCAKNLMGNVKDLLNQAEIVTYRVQTDVKFVKKDKRRLKSINQ